MRHRAMPIVVLLIAFAVRVHNLAFSPLWFDESLEYWAAAAPFGELLQGVRNTLIDPPFYSMLLHFWMLLGNDEFTLRLLSTFASLLAVAGTYILGKRVHSEQAGIIGALILALLPPSIRSAQEVGQYAFLVLALTFYLLTLHLALQTNSWKYWAAWGITGLVSVYTYYGSLLVIGPIALMSFIINANNSGWRLASRQLVTISLLAIMTAPLLVTWLPDQLFRGPTTSTFSIRGRPLLAEIDTFLTQTRDLMAYQLTGFIPNPAPWGTLRSAAWIIVLTAIFFTLRNRKKHLQVILWLSLCWIVYYIVGRVWAYPYGGSHHSLILTPLIPLALAIGVLAIWRIRRIAGLALLIGIVAVTILAPEEPPEDLRTVTGEWMERRIDETPAYVYYGAAPGFRYQLELHNDEGPGVPATWYWDCWAKRPEPYCADDNIYYGRWIRHLSDNEKVDEITSVVRSTANQFWLIFSHTDDAERQALLDVLEGEYITADAIEETGASAYLLQMR